jgi:hypothetical protein
MNRLTNHVEIEEARRRIAEILDGRAEWFCTEGRGAASCELRRGEWEVRAEGGALFLSYWGARGSRVWRVGAWEFVGGKLLFEATRRMGAVRALVEFVPRASARAAVEALAEARRRECERLAALASAAWEGSRVEEARVSAGARRGEPGRYARIILRRARVQVAATGPVVALGPEGADAFLSSALLWFAKLSDRRRTDAPARLRLLAPKPLAEATAERLSLLRESLREAIELYETDEARLALTPIRAPSLDELLDASARLIRPSSSMLSETARRIADFAPEAIDVVRARHGETLRFNGLAFARVRRVVEEEHVWFGVDGARKRRLLDNATEPEFVKLVEELIEHRRADAEDRRHALFRAAPEAWLEAILRRDVSRLDPGLRLAPLHAQFRTARAAVAGARPVDLLALRRDGRLAVIELKVSEDVALPLQGADYWRRVETHRRRGNIAAARLFGDAEIADEPPLVYLVAPALSFHRGFATLARAINPAIEMYRYDLNEDWRAGVRVARRARIV